MLKVPIVLLLATTSVVHCYINAGGCGLAKVKRNVKPYIVGGMDAYKGQYPFIVSLAIARDAIFHFCGGSIIDDRWVLTAAHCFQTSESLEKYSVRVGRLSMSDPEPDSVEHQIEKVINHPKYDPDLIDNDISLLKLKAPVNFTSLYANRVCLPPSTYDTDNKAARIVGWGDTYNVTGVHPPTTLQEAGTTIQSMGICATSYGQKYTHSMKLCAKSFASAVCSGDSGGPILVKNGIGGYTQVGITSFVSGSGCLNQHPNVFTRVSAYRSWIDVIIKANS